MKYLCFQIILLVAYHFPVDLEPNGRSYTLRFHLIIKFFPRFFLPFERLACLVLTANQLKATETPRTS